jgi:alpha-amylase
MNRLFQKGIKLVSILVLLSLTFLSCQFAVQPEAGSRALGGKAPLSNDAGWITQTNIYQIFVDRFAGNLDGVRGKLDYLEDLGVKTIWLMPIFEAMDDHGYNATDYYKIASNYGSNADLEELVSAAHQKGIRVILDLVINHIGSEHPWFASSDPNVRKDDWFIWADRDLGWSDPWVNASSGYFPDSTWFEDPLKHLDRNGNGDYHDDDYYYSVFGDGGGATMPDLNFNDGAARAEIIDEVENIMKFWIQQTGVDGFRCDAVRYLVEEGMGKQKDRPATHDIWQELRSRLDSFAPGAILVAEAPTETDNQMISYYGYDYNPNDDGINLTYSTDEFHSAFHFGYQGTLLAAAKNGRRPSNLLTDLYDIQGKLPAGTQDTLFLSNHDRFAGDRVATQLNNDISKIKMAAALYLSFSGNPAIYYGEEYGMLNGDGQYDEPIRKPMDWGEVDRQLTDPDSVLNHYKRVLALRNHYDMLRGGVMYFAPSHNNYGWDYQESESDTLAVIREWYGKMVLVIHNFSATNHSMHVDLTAGGALNYANGTKATAIMGQGSYADINSSNKTWFNVGTVYGRTSKMIFLGDISEYVDSTKGTYVTYENALGGGSDKETITVHFKEWGYAQSYSIHTWKDGVVKDYQMSYEGQFNGAHWWSVSFEADDTFSFCFFNSNNQWDGGNRNYSRSSHGNNIFINAWDNNIYTYRP